MSGLMKSYKESFNLIAEPILPSQLPKIKIDLPGLVRYIKENNTTYEMLTEKEKSQFYR